MAITIDWGNTNIINIPQADLLLIGNGLYELDVDAFRKLLRQLENEVDGLAFPSTHRHNTEITIAGVRLARVVEILPPYSIEFENGHYSVRLAGANNNIFDIQSGILVKNQVQVIPQNSAGLVVGGGALTQQNLFDIAQAVWDHNL